MARHESEFSIAGTASLTAAELEALTGDRADSARRRAAIARYLAAGDGWEEAGHQLSGAFAPPPRSGEG